MKRDAEVLVMLRERAKGRTQEQAATRAGMSVRTVREYERRAKLPSQLRQPRTYRSRPNPFADDWPWITTLLEDDPALQGQTLFGLLCDRQLSSLGFTLFHEVSRVQVVSLPNPPSQNPRPA